MLAISHHPLSPQTNLPQLYEYEKTFVMTLPICNVSVIFPLSPVLIIKTDRVSEAEGIFNCMDFMLIL